ncbi:MAG: AI-2E family transporter [Planctomycetota bacterium]
MNSVSQELRFQNTCLMVLAAVAIGSSLYALRTVLVPFVLAMFLVVGLAPVLEFIEKRMWAPRLVALAVAFLLGILILVAMWVLIWMSVASLSENAEDYHERLRQLIHRAFAYLPIDSGLKPGVSEVPRRAVDVEAVEIREEQAVGRYLAHQARQMAGQIAGAFTDLLASGTVVLIFMFFLLLGGGAAVPHRGMWRDIESKIRGYIVMKTVISALTGAAFGFALWLFGIPLAVVFGLLAFLLNYIPNIGPIIASILPLPLILLDPGLSLSSMILIIAITSGIQFVSGNIVEPKLMGNSAELHPVVILLALMFWGVIWGIIGMFLAVPITAALNIVLFRMERTRPIAQVLAGNFEALSEPDVESAPLAPHGE